MKNIVLIGISGSGKTYFGNELAKKISREFIDLDELVGIKAGLNIEDIFNKEGEEGFRRRESEAIQDIADKRNTIIATGGGAVINEGNMKILSKNGVIVFLHRSVEEILSNVEMSDRPLLKGNPERLKHIYEERLHLYEKYSDFYIEEGTKDEIINKLIHISNLEEVEKRLAVIGEPIDHSLSPLIHMGAMGHLIKELKYEKVEVKKDMLNQWVNTCGREKFHGFNVTMPHKESIIPFLDEIDFEAERIGSVNTVVNKEGKMHGYNTDGEGFSSALKGKGVGFANSIVTILGSGGAAKAIAMKAAEGGAMEIHIIARNNLKALTISQTVARYCGISCSIYPFPIENIKKGPWDSNIVINATPLGMKTRGADFTDFEFINKFQNNTFICDIVYSQKATRLILAAEAMGYNTMGGLEMLVEQALVADNLFMGVEIGRKKARKKVEEHLKGGAIV